MSTDNPNTGKPRLAFLGLGYMGSRMAQRLLNAGYPLTVWNRDGKKTEPLTRQGAESAATPREAVAQADMVISMLANDDAARQVVFGPEGALAGIRAGATLIEMSTISPPLVREEFAAAQARGVIMIDAPVSGSTPQAEEGSLVIFIGGDEAAFARCKPVLDVLGRATHPMGTTGAGATMKLVNNCLLGIGLQAIAEAIILGEKAGLDRDRLLDVLAETTVIAPALKGKLKNAQRDEYAPAFPLRLMHKDFSLALTLAAQLRAPMPVTAVAQQLCAAELAKDQEEDFSAVIQLMREMAQIPTP
jgi:3-hydroxyisobutyrate dehydrogenase